MATERQSTMRKLFAIILTLAMAISGFSAMAAPGDELIYDYEDEYGRYIRGMAKLGEYIYILPQDGDVIYRWSVANGIEEMPLAEGLFAYEDGYMTLHAFVSDENNLYALCSYVSQEDESNAVDDVLLWRVDVSGDKADFVDAVEMDWRDMIEYYDDYEYPRDVFSAFVSDGKLVFYTYGDSGDNVIGVFDIVSGEGELFDATGYMSGVCAYKDGQALALAYENMDDGISCKLLSIDVENGDIVELCAMPSQTYTPPSGLTYNADNDTLYYSLGGELHAMPAFEPAKSTAVAALNIRDSWSGIQPLLLADGRYVITDSEKIIACSTDPSKRNKVKLTVYSGYNSTVENALTDFSAAHGDVDVVITNDYGDLSDAMMNRDADVDIYYAYLDSEDYDALFTRGYLAELSGSVKLTAYADGMYAGIKKSIYREGELVAIPLSMYADSRGYSPAALTELGLAEDDLPRSWEELLQFLKDLPAYLEGHANISVFESYYIQSDVRTTLFYGLLQDYLLYMQNDPGAQPSFDNPKLAEMFDTIMTLDLGALGVAEERDEEGRAIPAFGVVAVEEARSVLFWDYAGVSPNVYAMEGEARPMPMSVFAGGEIYFGAQISVVFVNPYSANRELAIEYLEYVCDNIESEVATALNPGVNEPIINQYYEEGVASYEEWVASVERSIAECTDEDELAEWQAQLEEAEKYLEEYVRMYKYDISAESVALYRNYADFIVAERYSPLYTGDNYQEVYSHIERFLEGGIDAAEMLKNIDRKFQMMILEGM